MKKSTRLLLSAIACTLVVAILAISSLASIKLGDADGDQKAISVSDARQILRFAVGLDVPQNDEIRAAADVDRDGKITVTDARTVLRVAVNLDTIPDEPAIKPVETTATEPVATVEHEETTAKSEETTAKRENTTEKTTATKPTEKTTDKPTEPAVTAKPADPTTEPTTVPTTEPTTVPTTEPTTVPTTEPTTEPTTVPTTKPSEEPTTKPSTEPTTKPSEEPTTKPSTEPTTKPSEEPTTKPSTEPTTKPSEEPTTEHEHNFEYKQVDAVVGYSDWSNGTHMKTCACGVTTGNPEDCSFDEKFQYVDQNGNDTDQGPTCRKGANFYRVCSICGGKKQDSFGKLPHKYNKDNTELVSETKAATCTEPGEIEVKCESCEIYTKIFTTPALGHDIVDTDLTEGESVHCDRCGEDIAPADFDYNDNEFNIYKNGKYYYKGRIKTLIGTNTYTGDPIYETSEMTLAINPGQSVYMNMPFDGSTEIGYLAYKDKDLLGNTVTKKYFETFFESENESEKKRYYFYLEDYMVDMISDGDESMDFPSPDDADFKVSTDFNLKDTEKAQVVYQGNVCSRFTYKNDDTTYRVYMNGQKLLLIETLNKNVVTSATYFDFISAEIEDYMTTTKKQGTVLTGMVGLMQFAGYIGVLD